MPPAASLVVRVGWASDGLFSMESQFQASQDAPELTRNAVRNKTL
jgi:hypothetical protein